MDPLHPNWAMVEIAAVLLAVLDVGLVALCGVTENRSKAASTVLALHRKVLGSSEFSDDPAAFSLYPVIAVAGVVAMAGAVLSFAQQAFH